MPMMLTPLTVNVMWTRRRDRGQGNGGRVIANCFPSCFPLDFELSKKCRKIFFSLKKVSSKQAKFGTRPQIFVKFRVKISFVANFQCLSFAAVLTTSDVPSQWEDRNFDPGPLLPHFQPIFLKLKTKKDIRDTTQHAKFGWCETTGRGLRKWRIFAYFWFCLFCTLRLASRSHRRTDHDQWGLKTRVSAQGSAFWGSRW